MGFRSTLFLTNDFECGLAKCTDPNAAYLCLYTQGTLTYQEIIGYI
jgi:hypothetical protein